MSAGIARDCPRASSSASQDNCEAWYRVLAGQDVPDARLRIDRAVAFDPDRAEYLDTLAMVFEAEGKIDRAREAAWRAAAISPDDVYLILQAVRLDSLASH